MEGSDENVTDYILFTDSSYENSDIVFEVSAEELYSEVLDTKKDSKKRLLLKWRKNMKKISKGLLMYMTQ
mgnify:CR=1 FL=1